MSSPPRRGRLSSLPPTEPLDLGGGLSLAPRLKLLLTLFRPDNTVKPVDEWRLRLALLAFLRSPPLSLPLSDDSDLALRRRPDLHKRRRGDPVAHGTLCVRDLSFLRTSSKGDDDESEAAARERFLEWRRSVVERLDGIELNIEGVKFTLSVEIPPSDDFERMKKSWEDFYASRMLNGRNFSRGAARRPDTIIVKGVPSRWFAEPRVSSKASMLVTHTIFSVLGEIRNLNIAGDDDLGKKRDEVEGEFLSGLQCKIWVQFEKYDDFCNAMKVLCGRSMQKEGSRLKVDYEVDWDKDVFSQNEQQRPARSHLQERTGRVHTQMGHIKNEAPRLHSQVLRYDQDRARPKRFRTSSRAYPAFDGIGRLGWFGGKFVYQTQKAGILVQALVFDLSMLIIKPQWAEYGGGWDHGIIQDMTSSKSPSYRQVLVTEPSVFLYNLTTVVDEDPPYSCNSNFVLVNTFMKGDLRI